MANRSRTKARNLLDQLTIDETLSLVAGKSTWRTAAVPRLGVPNIKVSISIHPSILPSIHPPERRLKPAIVASLTAPVGLFLFAWTARSDIHWTVPTLGVMLASSGMAVILQSIFVYIMLAYPQYAASLLGGNGFVKATVAAGAIVMGRILYTELGVAQGTSLLGGLCLLCVVGVCVLYFFGVRLRARSRFAK